MAYGDPPAYTQTVSGVPSGGSVPPRMSLDAVAVLSGVTTSQLAGLNGPFNGAVVVTTGATSAGDGLGKSWVWSEGSTTPSNGTTVIGSGAYGRWLVSGADGGGGSTTALATTSYYSAQLDALAGSTGQVITTTGRLAAGDGVPQTWRWVVGSAATADGVLVRGSGAGRWLAVWDGQTFDARWAGITADGRTISDLRCTAGQPQVTSATAAFTSADEGRKILIRTPSKQATGTISITAGNRSITGVGTQFQTQIRDCAYDDAAGGQGWLIWPADQLHIDPWCIAEVTSQTALTLSEAPIYSMGSSSFYLETQLEATILSVQSATQATLSVSPAVSSFPVEISPGQIATIGTDNGTAINLALSLAIAAGASVLRLPAGMICRGGNNHVFTARGFTIRGAGERSTTIKDMRRASRELAAASITHSSGIFTGYQCDGCAYEDFSFDGSVPVLGMKHTTGGVSNAGGGRVGLVWDSSTNCAYRRVGTAGFGARDEMLYTQYSPTENITWDDCTVVASVNAINANHSGNNGGGAIVKNCRATGDFQALVWGGRSGTITGNQFLGKSPPSSGRKVGNSVVVLSFDSSFDFVGNTIADNSSPEYGAFPLQVSAGNGYANAGAVGNMSGNTLRNLQYGSHIKDCAVVGISAFTDASEAFAIGAYSFRGAVFSEIYGSGLGTIGVDTHGGALIFVDETISRSIDVGDNNAVAVDAVGQGITTMVRVSERTPMDRVDFAGNRVPRGCAQLQVLVKGERVTDATTRRRTSTTVDLAGTTTFTVHCWISARETVDGFNVLVDRGRNDGSNAGWHVRVQNNGIQVGCGSVFILSSGLPAGFVGREHVVTVVLSGTALALYCDGVSLGTATATYSPVAGETYFGCASTMAGAYNNAETPLLAVAGGAYALTAAQVLAHYQACVAKQSLLKHASDQHYWRFSTRGGAVADVLDEITGNSTHRVVTSAGTAVSKPLVTDLATIVSMS